jgi:hypothetical protein
VVQVRAFRLNAERALTVPPQYVFVCMRQYCSHTHPASCHNIDLQCSLSDSVLAWRCYVIFGKRRWLKWTLTIVIIFITGACHIYLWGLANFCAIVSGIVSSVIESIESIDFFWRDREVVKLSYRLDLSTLLTTLTWAVFSLIFNTVLSTSIIAKIV